MSHAERLPEFPDPPDASWSAFIDFFNDEVRRANADGEKLRTIGKLLPNREIDPTYNYKLGGWHHDRKLLGRISMLLEAHLTKGLDEELRQLSNPGD